MRAVYSCMGSVWLGQMFDLHQTGRSSFAFLMLQENKDAPAREPTALGEFTEGRMSLIGNNPWGPELTVHLRGNFLPLTLCTTVRREEDKARTQGLSGRSQKLKLLFCRSD